MPVKRLPKKLVNTISANLDTLFERVKGQALGPGHVQDKRLAIGFDRWLSLPGIFEQAAKEEGSKPDLDLMESALRTAANYIDATKEKAKARVVNEINAHLRAGGTGKLEPEEFEDKLRDALKGIWTDVTEQVHRIIDTEASHVKNLGLLDGIQQVNAERGIADPTVFFVIARDADVCEECLALHTVDGGRPRVWKLSEIGQGYHERGDDHPKLGGLHPHCRCVMATLLPGFGFDAKGRVKYIERGHDEHAEQRIVEKAMKKSLRLYHGTTGGKVRDFKTGPAGGLFFTDSPEYAANYGDVSQYDVKIKRPFDVSRVQPQSMPVEEWHHALQRAGMDTSKLQFDPVWYRPCPNGDCKKYMGHSVYGMKDEDGTHNVALHELMAHTEYGGPGNLVEELKRQGYDGIKMPPEDSRGSVWVAFHPKQAKLVKSSDPEPMSVPYIHRVSSLKTGDFGDQYQQHVEAAGEYMTPMDDVQRAPRPEDLARGDVKDKTTGRQWFEHGVVHFQNPLRVPHTFEQPWKLAISRMFGGKGGSKLTAAIRAAGYDGVVAHDPEKGHLVEVLNIAGRKDVTHPLPEESYRYGRGGLPPKTRKSDSSDTGPENAENIGQPRRLYHLTDKANFKLDPNYKPINNTTLGGTWPHTGLFLADDVEPWVNGYGYWRPWVAEFEAPHNLHELPGVVGGKGKTGYSGETFVPAAHYNKLRMTRVLPLDAWCREHYGEHGWTEQWADKEFDTGKPIPPGHYNMRGYRFEGDARQWPVEQRRAYARQVVAFRKQHAPGAFVNYAKSEPPQEPKAAFTGPTDPALEAAVPDAPYILEPEDFKTHDWKLEQRPVSSFQTHPNPTQCCEDLHNEGRDPYEAHEKRLDAIQRLASDEWIQKHPVIAYHDGRVEDGHHRIEVYRRCNVENVPTLVGYPKVKKSEPPDRIYTPEEVHAHMNAHSTEGRQFQLEHVRATAPHGFRLQHVPVDPLYAAGAGGSDNELVERYRKMTTPPPPIVLDAEGGVFDGNHRVSAAWKNNVEYLPAFVPVMKKSEPPQGPKAAWTVDEKGWKDVEHWPTLRAGYDRTMLPIDQIEHMHLYSSDSECQKHPFVPLNLKPGEGPSSDTKWGGGCHNYVKKLAAHMRAGGTLGPVVAVQSKENVYIARDANHRISAAILNGETHVPVALKKMKMKKSEPEPPQGPTTMKYLRRQSTRTPVTEHDNAPWPSLPEDFEHDRATGQHIVFHHGTPHQFEQFEHGHHGHNTEGFAGLSMESAPVQRAGFFFTRTPEFAQSFAAQNGAKGRVVRAHLALGNVADLEDGRLGLADDEYERVRSAVPPGFLQQREKWRLFDGEHGKKFVSALKEAGYDSARFSELDHERRDSETHIVFEPHQIRQLP